MSRFYASLLALCLATPALAAPITPGTLIQNGGFETGNFAGWTQADNIADTGVISQAYDGFSAENGNAYAILGPVGRDGVLGQTFADAAGGTLTISFWLANDGDVPNDFSASLDGNSLVRLSDAATMGWSEFTYTKAATGSDTLQFSFRNDPGYFALDNVSVTETNPIPEPAGLLVLPLGLLAMTRLRPRRWLA